MATIKSYTDLEQSKKLAEILPLESADYCWGIDDETLHYNNSPYPCAWKDYSCKEYYIPCWSLAALLNVFEDKGFYYKLHFDGVSNTLEVINIDSPNIHKMIYNDYSIDACYEMIIRLNELKML